MPNKGILYVTALLGALFIGVGVYMFIANKSSNNSTTQSSLPKLFGESKQIPANVVWTDTGSFVNKGQKVTIQASGEVNVGSPGDASDKWVSPDGWGSIPSKSWLCNNAPCKYKNASNSLGSLVGKFGKAGKPFAVGTQNTITNTGSGGNLFLGVDDSLSDENGNILSDTDLLNRIYFNNQGSFTAVINVSN